MAKLENKTAVVTGGSSGMAGRSPSASPKRVRGF